MKKRKIMLGLLLTASIIGLAACGSENSVIESSTQVQESSATVASSNETNPSSQIIESSSSSSEEVAYTTDSIALANLSCGGVVNDMPDFNQYKNTDSYVTVTNENEFLVAIENAKTSYTTTLKTVEEGGYIERKNTRKNETNWKNAITKGLYIKNDQGEYIKIPSDTPYDPNDTVYTADMTYYEDSPYTKVTYEQTLEKESQVHVIEINCDLDLGYNKIKDLDYVKNKAEGESIVFENWDKSGRLAGSTDVYCDPDIQEAGISKIKIEGITNLLIYSKNGSKIKHAGFSVSSCKNVAFRNLDMDEIWMWEDSTSTTPTIKVGDYDSFGWAYFKVSFSENIWIDHCKFGKSFDGQIDFSNPCYTTLGTYSKAPYQGTGNNGLHISFCDFNAGDASKDGYIYKMMQRLEDEYQKYSNDSSYEFSSSSARYYFTLRDAGLKFKEVLNGLAVPQKKAFLWGDSGDPYVYNKYLNVSLTSCKIKNIEDRLPKVRGGMAYIYNTQVDNTEYFSYLAKLKSVSSTVTSANSKYKLSAVSQGILSGLDASVYLESVEYSGISSYLKNNDSPNDNYPTTNGGYMIKNSIIGGISGSIDIKNDNNPFSTLNVSGDSLSPSYFQFKVNGEKQESSDLPISITPYDLLAKGSLNDYFTENLVGINSNYTQSFWLTTNYSK